MKLEDVKCPECGSTDFKYWDGAYNQCCTCYDCGNEWSLDEWEDSDD